jgi:hypothetical protein
MTDNHWYDDYKTQNIFIKSSQHPTENEGPEFTGRESARCVSEEFA